LEGSDHIATWRVVALSRCGVVSLLWRGLWTTPQILTKGLAAFGPTRHSRRRRETVPQQRRILVRKRLFGTDFGPKPFIAIGA
jgi:hypothetical protein